MLKRKYLMRFVFVLAAATLMLSACQSYSQDDAQDEAQQPTATVEPGTQPDETTPDAPATMALPEEPAPAMMIALAGVGDLGQVLVDAEGYTLYVFLNDKPGTSNCTGNCAANWPPLLAEGEVVTGDGLDAGLVATITRDDGTIQVTYNGRPLYYYYDDNNPGDANGQGANDVWYVISGAGEPVEADPVEDEEDPNPDY